LALEVQWFGTTTLAISDEGETLLFDPFFNHPSFLETISPFSYRPKKEVVQKWLKTIASPLNITAVLTSHSHYDHILDAPIVLEMTKANFYGSPTAIEVVKDKKLTIDRLIPIKVNNPIQIGKFKITPFKGIHPPHFMGMTLASGKLDHPLEKPAALYEYKMGEVFNFLIEHPKGKILFHPSAYITKDPILKTTVDLLILGIANRKSSEELINHIVLPSQSSKILVVHHDDLFLELKESQVPILFLSNYEDWQKVFKSLAPKVKEIQLHYGQKYEVKPSKLPP